MWGWTSAANAASSPRCARVTVSTSAAMHGPRRAVDRAVDRQVVAQHEQLVTAYAQPVADERVLTAGPGEADAVRDALDRVERVHEREAAGVRVERVDPASVRRLDARRGVALHQPGLLRLVCDAARQKRRGSEVVLSHDVVLEVSRLVLDEIEPRAVGRERVERERAGQRDRLA